MWVILGGMVDWYTEIGNDIGNDKLFFSCLDSINPQLFERAYNRYAGYLSLSSLLSIGRRVRGLFGYIDPDKVVYIGGDDSSTLNTLICICIVLILVIFVILLYRNIGEDTNKTLVTDNTSLTNIYYACS
jgi:hypothetical protein